MNKKTLIALAAAGVIILGGGAALLLAGRGDAPAEPTPPATTAPVVTDTPAPEETPLPSQEVLPTPTPEGEPTPEETKTPAATPKPTEKPAATPTPAPKPTPAPTPAPTPTPEPESSVVQSVWDEIAKGDLPALTDMDAATLKDVYGLSSSDVSEYICKMPMMSANIHEFFIAKVADGKMDTVKAACEARQKALAGGFLYPSQTELVEGYQIVTSGDYILFCITDDPDAAVAAFHSYAK